MKHCVLCVCVCCRLPQKRVLTLNLELPESWLVEPVMALHDLDNLRLADIQEQVTDLHADTEYKPVRLAARHMHTQLTLAICISLVPSTPAAHLSSLARTQHHNGNAI